jgi:hypothetical protein
MLNCFIGSHEYLRYVVFYLYFLLYIYLHLVYGYFIIVFYMLLRRNRKGLVVMKNVNSRAAIRNLSLKLLVAAATLGASSAHAATANIPVSATIIPPIVLSEPADLRMGQIAAGAAIGTVVLVLPALIPAAAPTTLAPVTNSTRTVGGGAVAVGGLTCNATTVLCGVGSLQIAGQNSASFATVTTPNVTLTGPGPSMLLTVTRRYGATGVAGATAGAGTLSATGTAVLVVGGSLAVGTSALQTSGAYTGTMAVVIDY